MAKKDPSQEGPEESAAGTRQEHSVGWHHVHAASFAVELH